ncbi:MAG: hypothetical protein K6B70_00605 [Clostridia bacterium]|nr:hypothetical protein [Clostridia bacterium]
MVLIEDKDGNGSEVNIASYNSLYSDEDNNQEKEDEKIQVDNKGDKTTAEKVIPQTGKYTVIAIIASVVIGVFAIVSLKKYKNNVIK